MKKTVLLLLMLSAGVLWLASGYVAALFMIGILLDKWKQLLWAAGLLVIWWICTSAINHLGKRIWG